MKRLFYVTNNLDDAESISNEVHKLGIDDHHFFVLSRDEKGLKTHHLHGSRSLDKTEILAAKKRANFFAILACIVAIASVGFAIDLIPKNILFIVIAAVIAFVVVKSIVILAGTSFDDYFKGVFDEHLNCGEVIIIIDVAKNQSQIIEKQLENHPDASFLADSSNFSSPIPQ